MGLCPNIVLTRLGEINRFWILLARFGIVLVSDSVVPHLAKRVTRVFAVGGTWWGKVSTVQVNRVDAKTQGLVNSRKSAIVAM
jgi:hypothetical protein